MDASALTGKVVTVLGPIEPAALGTTLMHEHLRVDYSPNFKPGDLPGHPLLADTAALRLWDAPMGPEHAGLCRSFFAQMADNMVLGVARAPARAATAAATGPSADDEASLCCGGAHAADAAAEADVVHDATMFRRGGGRAIVECSITGIRAPHHEAGLVRLSAATGLHVVMGTGYYLARTHPPGMDDRTEASLRDEFISHIVDGVEVDVVMPPPTPPVGDPGAVVPDAFVAVPPHAAEATPTRLRVRAGIIGELGCTTKIAPNERKVLRAAAAAFLATGAAISVHPGYSADAPFEILDELTACGVPPGRVVIGHVDRGLLDDAALLRLAQRGCVLEFDQFGWGCSFQHAIHYGIDYPSDFERCRMMRALFDAGHGAQVVASHDIAFKSRLTRFGGHSYNYLQDYVVPYMLKRGFSADDVTQVFVHNPARVLTFAAPVTPA